MLRNLTILGLHCGAGSVGDSVGGGEREAFERRGIVFGIIQFILHN